MENNHSLIIKSDRTTIMVMAKNGEEFSEHDIQVKSVLGYYWSNNLPVIETFLKLLESVIKRSINQVFPHDKLLIEYNVSANDDLENSSLVTIIISNVEADKTKFQIIGEVITLEGIDLRNTVSKVTSFRRKFNKVIQKEL
jgi:hypothetical protein